MNGILPKPETLPDVYWLTRDRIGGELQDDVEVWASRPERQQYEDGDVLWFGQLNLIDKENTCIGAWTSAESKARFAGSPDNDRECVRVGRESNP